MSYTNQSQQWASLQASKKHLSYDYLEKPAMYKYLGKDYETVLCLGSGTGEEVEYIAANCSPKIVYGLDNAAGLIELAGQMYPRQNTKHETIAMENIHKWLEYENLIGRVDLIYSSLAVHYIEDWDKLMGDCYRLLRPGGVLLFSTHHPIKWGSQTIRSKEKNSFLMGYTKNLKPEKGVTSFQVYGDYLTTRAIWDKLLGKIDIKYYHRSISTIFSEVQKAGFLVTNLDEPLPIDEAKNLKNDFWAVHSQIPLFLVVRAVKPN
ncbi:MAG: class I SAM-dependent methyltransferase [Candidatus Parcubacteria bacterium]|nr:class I SAM-dependent methyltransferase [Candidatus Paceibacterota bacterium]